MGLRRTHLRPVMQGIIDTVHGFLLYEGLVYVKTRDKFEKEHLYRLLPNTCSLKGQTTVAVIQKLRQFGVPEICVK